MRSADGRHSTGRWPMLGLVLLGSCTLWLVIQNTILIAAVAAAPPEPLIRVAGALVKVGGHLLERLWPTAVAFLAPVLPLVLVLIHRDPHAVARGGA